LRQYLEMSFRVVRDGEYMMQFAAFLQNGPDAVPEDSAQEPGWRRRGAQRFSEWSGSGEHDLVGMTRGEAC